MSWKKVKLGQLVDNFSVRAKDVGGAEGLDFYGVSNSEGIIKTKYAAEDKAEDYKIIEKDCFAYNPYRVNVGSIGMVADNIRGLISPAYVIFKPKPNTIKAELLFKFLKSSEGLRQIKFYARGTVRQALRFEDLCNIELSIPNYDEQEILFEKLNNTQLESDLLSIELNHQLDLVKKLRQQLLQDAVQGKLVEQDKKDEPASELLNKIKAEKEKLIAEKKLKKEKELPSIKPEEIPFEIPDNWVWCRLGGACQINPRNKAEDELDVAFIPMPLISQLYNVTPEYQIKKWKEIKSGFTHFANNDVVVAKITPCFENSKAGIMKDLPNGIGAGTTELYVIRGNELVNPKIIYAFVKSSDFLKKGEKIMRGVSGQQRVPSDYLINTLFALPPLAEQNRIIQKLDDLMQYCNDLEASIKQSQQQNEKLLQQVLREALRGEGKE